MGKATPFQLGINRYHFFLTGLQEWIAKLSAVYNCEMEVEELDAWDEWSSIQVDPTPIEEDCETVLSKLFEGEPEDEEEGTEPEGESVPPTPPSTSGESQGEQAAVTTEDPDQVEVENDM